MVITAIKSDGVAAKDLREYLSKHYDLRIEKTQHSVRGEDLFINITLNPKGFMPVKNDSRKSKEEF